MRATRIGWRAFSCRWSGCSMGLGPAGGFSVQRETRMWPRFDAAANTSSIRNQRHQKCYQIPRRAIKKCASGRSVPSDSVRLHPDAEILKVKQGRTFVEVMITNHVGIHERIHSLQIRRVGVYVRPVGPREAVARVQAQRVRCGAFLRLAHLSYASQTSVAFRVWWVCTGHRSAVF